MNTKQRPTRGKGLLEKLLSALRARKVLALLKDHQPRAEIVDIGSGSFPHFLLKSDFETRYGLDRVLTDETVSDARSLGVRLVRYDLEQCLALPFEDRSIQVVTLLAVYEHLDQVVKDSLFLECRRVLAPRGRLILTTPAWWTGPILSFLARIGCISPEELEEHRPLSRPAEIVADLIKAGFDAKRVTYGFFELGLNQWAQAIA